MIKIIGIDKQEIPISEAYLGEDNSALAISTSLAYEEADQKYHCWKFSKSGIVIVDEQGFWTDFEVMLPPIIEKAPCQFQTLLNTVSGFPLIQVLDSLSLAAVEKEPESLTLWLEKELLIDLIVVNANSKFYISQDCLAGIWVPIRAGA